MFRPVFTVWLCVVLGVFKSLVFSKEHNLLHVICICVFCTVFRVGLTKINVFFVLARANTGGQRPVFVLASSAQVVQLQSATIQVQPEQPPPGNAAVYLTLSFPVLYRPNN